MLITAGLPLLCFLKCGPGSLTSIGTTLPPRRQNLLDFPSHHGAGLRPFDSAGEQLVIAGELVPDMRLHRQHDRFIIELFGGRAAPDAAAVFKAGMFCDLFRGFRRTPGKHTQGVLTKGLHVLRIQLSAALRFTLAPPSPHFFIRQTFFFRLVQCF